MTKEELIQLIDNNIYENPDGEITGESLNAVLKAIVDDGGTEVEANPTGDATETLGKIKIGKTIYTAPQGPQGKTGATGATGPQGEQGPAGPQGDTGNPGHNPNLGTYTISDYQTDAPTTDIQDGDYIVVLNTTQSPVTGEIYTWDGSAWQPTGRDANMAYFGSGELLSNINIDNTHLKDPAQESLCRADDAMQINSFANRNFTEEKMPVLQTYIGKSILPSSASYDTSSFVDNNNKNVYELAVGSYKKIRVPGAVTTVTQSANGYVFFDIDDNVIFTSNYEVSDESADQKEYVLDVPQGAVLFRTTLNNSSKFYCYGINGDNLTEKIEYQINLQQEENGYEITYQSEYYSKSLSLETDNTFGPLKGSRMYALPKECKSVTIKALDDESAVVAFFKHPGLNVPYFSDAYPVRIDILKGTELTFDMHDDCNYLLVRCIRTTGGIYTFPEKIKVNLNETSVPFVDRNLRDLVYSKTRSIDTSGSKPLGRRINSENNWSGTPTSNSQGSIVRIEGYYNKLVFKASSTDDNVISLLKDVDNIYLDETPHFATGFEDRIIVTKNSTIVIENLNEECKYLYYSITNGYGESALPEKIEFSSSSKANGCSKKRLNLLFIGSSNEQECISYLPPILNEILDDYDIIYGDMYKASSLASQYINYYKNNTPCEAFNLWTPGADSWSRYTGKTLEDVLHNYKWDFILFKEDESSESDSVYRQFIRILQKEIDYPCAFFTQSRFGRHSNQRTTVPQVTALESYLNIRNYQNHVVADLGITDTIPIGTAIQNARTSLLKRFGTVFPAEGRYFTVPSKGRRTLRYRLNVRDILVATKTSGDGTLKFTAVGSDTVIGGTQEFSDSLEHTFNISMDSLLTRFDIVNDGNEDAEVYISMPLSVDNFMMNADNTHLQAGIAVLIAAYTIALKVLEWTGNRNRGINKTSWLPTMENTESAACMGLHGNPCGIVDYIGTDGNHYDMKDLVKVGNDWYVEESLDYGSVVTQSSVRIVNESMDGPIIFENVYAAQEIAEIAVGNPNNVVDCDGVVIEIPSKNEE